MQITKKILFLLLFFISFSTLIIAQDSNVGKLVVNVNLPESFYLINGNDLINAEQIDSGSVLDLEAGLYSFTIISKFIDDFKFRVQIIPNQINTYSHAFKTFRIGYRSTFEQLENQENLVISTDKLSEIFINGEPIGKHYASLLLNPGTYNIKTIHPTAGSLEQEIEVKWNETFFFTKFNEPQFANATSINLIPGGGYLINGQKDKAIVTYLTMGLLIGSYFTIDRKIKDQRAIFNLQNLENLQTISLVGFGLVYALSTIDGMRKPKNGYPANTKNLEFTSISLNKKVFPMTSLKFNF